MADLFNRETGAKIANVPEELPPLREGYIRLIHQTHHEYAKSFADNGLVYNGGYAGKSGFSHYTDIGSMALAYTEEGFWDRLTAEEVRHRGADALAVFDMPIEECGAHQKLELAQYLNGTVSRGYMVGMIPNYGTKDSNGGEKLSVSEMEEKKKLSMSNPLPPRYETPGWRESVNNAKASYRKVIDALYSEENYQLWNPRNKTEPHSSSEEVPADYLQAKLQFVKNKLKEKGAEKDMEKTGNSRIGEVSDKNKTVAKEQQNASKQLISQRKQSKIQSDDGYWD